jgi:hypothetical protein
MTAMITELHLSGAAEGDAVGSDRPAGSNTSQRAPDYLFSQLENAVRVTGGRAVLASARLPERISGLAQRQTAGAH